MAACALMFVVSTFQGCFGGNPGTSDYSATIDRFGNFQDHYPEDEAAEWIEDGANEFDETPDYGMAYANCDEAREYGHAPVYEGEAEYAPHLDRDGDGVGCEPWNEY